MGASKELSARAKLRRYLNEQLRDADEVHIPTLVSKVVEHFSGDQDFLDALAQEILPDWTGQTARIVMSQMRGGATNILIVGDDLVTRDQFDRRVTGARFAAWFEHAGDRHVRLPAMTRRQLEEAAETRELVGVEQLRRAEFLRLLAKDLDDGQKVGDRYNDADLNRIHRSVYNT